MYFKNFPVVYYPVVIGGVKQYAQLKDITINVRFVKEFLSNITLYDLYDIADGETPEMISEKFYDTPNYHWLLMVANERFDYLADFPVTYNGLIKHVNDKYGIGNADQIHHYEADGFVVMEDYPNAVAFTNFMYEEKLNEQKRTIKIINKSIIDRIASDFIRLMK
jgi:hypothetical protein